MGSRITVSATILSLRWVSCLWYVNKLSCSWLQKLHYRSVPFDFLNVLGALLGNCLELIIGKVLCGVQSFLGEVFFHTLIGGIVSCFLLFLRDLWSALLGLKLVLLVTSSGRLIRSTLWGIVTVSVVTTGIGLRCLLIFLSCFCCSGIHQHSQLHQIILDDHV